MLNTAEKTLYKLPVWQILSESIQLPRRYFLTLLKFGLPLISLIVITNILPISGIKFLNMVVAVLSMMSLILGIVGCHHTFLLDRENVQNTRIIRWTMQETRYIAWWILVSIIATIPFAAIPFIFPVGEQNIVIDSLLILFLLSAYLYVLSRLSLILPAVAISAPNRKLRTIWNLSKGNEFRLMLLIGLFPMITTMLLSLSDKIGLFSGTESFVTTILSGIIFLIIGIIEIGLLSLSYRYLTENNKL